MKAGVIQNLILIWVGMSLFRASAYGQADSPPSLDVTDTPDSVLMALKNRDDRFDDYRLEYTRTRTENVDPAKKILKELFRRSKWQHSATEDVLSPQLKQQLSNPPAQFVVESKCTESLVVRGTVAAFEHSAEERRVVGGDPELQNVYLELSGKPADLERWSNAAGKVQSSVNSNDEHLLFVATDMANVATVDQQRMMSEFALGFGFGKRLIQLKTVARLPDDMLQVTGLITVWQADESKCQLLIDEKLVVREARIQSDVGGNLHEFETRASGEFDQQILPILPASGHFRKSWLGTKKEGKLTGIPTEKANFELRLVAVSHPSSDSEFQRMMTFDVTDRTVVRDVSKGKTIKESHRKSFPSNPSRTVWWVLILHGGMIVVLGLVLYTNRRRRTSLQDASSHEIGEFS